MLLVPHLSLLSCLRSDSSNCLTIRQPCLKVCGASTWVEHIHPEQLNVWVTNVKTILHLKTQGCNGNLLIKMESAVWQHFSTALQFCVGCEVLVCSPWVEKMLGKGITSSPATALRQAFAFCICAGRPSGFLLGSCRDLCAIATGTAGNAPSKQHLELVTG